MGVFADTLFSTLLGWLRGAAQTLWQLFTGKDAAAWLTWVLDNWLPLTVLLCIVGMTVDAVVHFLRWQPWRIWRQWFRKDQADENQDSGRFRQWVYADGSTRTEEVVTEEAAQDEQLHPPVRRVRRAPQLAEPGDPGHTYHQPYYPPQWQGESKGGPKDE